MQIQRKKEPKLRSCLSSKISDIASSRVSPIGRSFAGPVGSGPGTGAVVGSISKSKKHS